MRSLRRIFTWICQPQSMVGFVALCLCIGGIGSAMRVHAVQRISPFRPVLPAQALKPRIDCRIQPCIAITFDDGPSPDITPQILDILARQQVRATFFEIGVRVAGQEALVRRQHREGHEIGNHSWSHPDLSRLTPEETSAQIQATQQAIAHAGVPVPRLLRPPYGAVNEMVVAHNNLSIVRWNVDPEDWLLRDPAKIQEHMLAAARPGSIILLHDIYPSTVAALEPTLQILKQQYQLVTVSQLLNLTPGDQGQYFSQPR